AKLKPSDRIMKVENQPFSGRDQFLQRLDDLSPGQEVKLEVKRKEGGKTETVTLKLGDVLDAVPDELPNGTYKKALAPRKQPQMPFDPMNPMPPRPAPTPPKKD